MKLLLVQSSVYLPSYGGANKSNRLLLEGMAARGHICSAIAPTCGQHVCQTVPKFRDEMAARNILLIERADADSFQYKGVEVHAVRDTARLVASFEKRIHAFAPDWIIVASEDPRQLLLNAAIRVMPTRVIYLARTTLSLPFGPDSPFHYDRARENLSRVRAITTVSDYLTEYFRVWGGLEATTLPLCPNGPGPFPVYTQFESGYVMMINPCTYKGLSIFVALADEFPDVHFAAVPTWGTTAEDLMQLNKRSNIRLLEPKDEINDILALCRVVVVPSLWAEAKANIITEAMLRGIPVVSSDVGGNREAHLGVDYVLPVTPLETYTGDFDALMLPRAVTPVQNCSPWITALGALVSDRQHYESLAREARSRAVRANDQAGPDVFESFLFGLSPHRGAS